MVSLDHGGYALRVKWKLPKKLFTDLQATARGSRRTLPVSMGTGIPGTACNKRVCIRSRGFPLGTSSAHPQTGMHRQLRNQALGRTNGRVRRMRRPHALTIQLNVCGDPQGGQGSQNPHIRPQICGYGKLWGCQIEQQEQEQRR